MLEDALRRMFAARVASSPATADPAGAAIRRARRIRQRRTAIGSAAAAVLALVAFSTALVVRDRMLPSGPPTGPIAALDADVPPASEVPSASPTPPLRLDRVGLDLRVANQLWTTDGRRIPLVGVGLVTNVYRVPAGWVYAGADRFRLMRPDGTAIDLASADGRWVLRSDGRRVAYAVGTSLHVADLGTDGLVPRATIAVPAGVRPVAFLGNRIVIADGTGRAYDIVDPEREYSPAWRTDVLEVYGQTTAGGVAALVRSGSRLCLAAVTAVNAGLHVDRLGGCGLGLRPQSGGGQISLGGRWLTGQVGQGRIIIDLPQALAGKAGTVPCPVRSTTAVTWVNTDTLAAADERGAVLCRTNGTQEVLPLPDDLLADWQFVPVRVSPPR